MVWFRQSSILQALIAARADGPKVGWLVIAAFGFVLDVSHRQPDGATGMEWVFVSRRQAAHLAGVAVSFQDERPRFFGDAALKGRKPLWSLDQVLAGLQIGPVFVRENLITLLVAKFPDPSRPFGFPTGHLLKLLALNDPPGVCEKEVENQLTLLGFKLLRRLKSLKPSWHSLQTVQSTLASPARGVTANNTGLVGRVCQ